MNLDLDAAADANELVSYSKQRAAKARLPSAPGNQCVGPAAAVRVAGLYFTLVISSTLWLAPFSYPNLNGTFQTSVLM